MLGKPLSHLRPLLRLPTHSAPDHFTSNPSLLHHFPQQGGHAIVSAGPSSAQAAGQGAGGAGRAGWGGGAGTGGGGYTGHARAFLGLPQTTSVDPSSGLSNDDKEQERAAALNLHRRYQATRFAQTQSQAPVGVLEMSEGLRSGEGRTLKAINMDEVEMRSLDPDMAYRVLAAREDEGDGNGRRRSSIAYPRSRRQQGATTPPVILDRTSSPVAGTPRRELGRSTSSMDIWMGTSVVRPQLRSFSTRRTPIPLPDVDIYPIDPQSITTISDNHIATPTSSRHRLIPQPNRVLMDLAGRDLPPSRSISRRYNSSLATEAPRSWDDMPLPAMTTTEPSPKEAEDTARDLKIYKAIVGRTIWRTDSQQQDHVAALVQHYRSPRQLAPFDERQQPGDPTLTDAFPLPSTYSVATYNACLEALVTLRKSGESIAKILEAYNEMLERDVLPNMRTYHIVIRALCLRETDVWLAVARWEKEKAWAKWKRESVGEEYVQDEQSIHRDKLIEGYTAEGNLDSALRLFSAAKVFQVNSTWRFHPAVYNVILRTIATQLRPDLGGMRQVFDHAKTRQRLGLLGLYRFVFEALGRAGHADELSKRWADFQEVEFKGIGNKLSDWMEVEGGTEMTPEEEEVRTRGAKMTAYQSAIRAFARIGETAKAEEIVSMIEDKNTDLVAEKRFYDTDAYAALILGIADKDVESATKRYNELKPKITASKLGRLPLTELNDFVDALTFGGQWRTALEVIMPDITKPDEYARPDIYRVRHLYHAILAAAENSSDAVSAKTILDNLTILCKGQNWTFETLPIRQHLRLLEKFGLWADAEPLLQSFQILRGTEPQALGYLERYVHSAQAHLNFQQYIGLVATSQRHGMALSPIIAELVLDKYNDERTNDPATWQTSLAAMTNHHWGFLTKIVRTIEGERYEEGEFDDVMENITEDLVGEARKAEAGRFSFKKNSTTDAYVAKLEKRFGKERTAAMLQDVVDVPTSPSEPSTAFSMPASPTSYATPPTSPSVSSLPTSGRRLKVEGQLSSTIDSINSPRASARISPSKAFDILLQALNGRSVVPHVGSIGRLINALGREGAEDKVVMLYNLAQTVLSENTITARQAEEWREVECHMLIASCHLGHLEQAGAHRQRIIDAGLVPSADAYATMIASSKDTTDDALVARALWDESQSLGVVPNLYLYNTIISKLSKARKAEVALELFNHMKAAGIQPSSVTYGAVINACCRVGDAQSAETLFEEMVSMSNFKPRVPPYNTMMQFFIGHVPSRERVLHYYNLLRQAGVPPSAHTYKLLIDAYSTLPPIDLVSMERVYGELLSDRNVQLQGTHVGSLITAYGIYGDDLAKAMEVFESGPGGRTFHKDAVVWEAILNVIAHRGTLGDLEAMRQRMISSGIRPTAYVYNVLITGYARAQRLDEARAIFESMGDSVTGVAAPNNHPMLLTSSGYAKPQTITEQPTNMVYREPSTYEAMIRAEIGAGEIGRAQQVLRRMEARSYPWAVYMRVKALVDEASVSNLDLPPASQSDIRHNDTPLT